MQACNLLTWDVWMGPRGVPHFQALCEACGGRATKGAEGSHERQTDTAPHKWAHQPVGTCRYPCTIINENWGLWACAPTICVVEQVWGQGVVAPQFP